MKASTRLLIAAAVFLVAAVLAWLPPRGSGDDSEPPTVVDPLPFDHSTHRGAFTRIGLMCADCHPVGLRAESGAVNDLPAPRSICHGCHRGEADGAPRGAASRCGACHPDREELIPETHGIGWHDDHAPEARSLRAGCDDCHDRGQCIDCHDTRGAAVHTPHPPGFRSLHGIDARLDGATCATCHAAETCVRCHEQGGWPW